MLRALLCRKIMGYILELQGQGGSIMLVIVVLKRLSLKSEVSIFLLLEEICQEDLSIFCCAGFLQIVE